MSLTTVHWGRVGFLGLCVGACVLFTAGILLGGEAEYLVVRESVKQELALQTRPMEERAELKAPSSAPSGPTEAPSSAPSGPTAAHGAAGGGVLLSSLLSPAVANGVSETAAVKDAEKQAKVAPKIAAAPTWPCTSARDPAALNASDFPPMPSGALHWQNVAIVRTAPPAVLRGMDYILYIGEFAEQDTSTILRLRSVLEQNLAVDAVGGSIRRGNTIVTSQCHTIERCHWTLLLHSEYTCSAGPFMECDSTSPVFMVRAKHKKLLADAMSMGPLAPLHVAIGLQKLSVTVLTDMSLQLDLGEGPVAQPSSNQQLHFVRAQAIDEIRNRGSHVQVLHDGWWDGGYSLNLCTNSTCDAKIVSEIVKRNTWDKTGTTMPTFAYKAYVTAFQRAVEFLNTNNVSYLLYGGAELGLLKLGRLLPWDAGDVDLVVDVDQFGCKKWMSMVKAWADKYQMIHPHRDKRGAQCIHYGVYAMPTHQQDGKTTNVNDPFSIGLVTFSNMSVVGRTTLEPFSYVEGHGVSVRVPANLWGDLKHHYKSGLLSHQKKNTGENFACKALKGQEHNCVVDTNGTSLDTCMKHTIFG